MRPEDLSLITDDAVRRLVVAPRYSGRLSLHYELVCDSGGIRECSISTTNTIRNLDIEKIREKKLDTDKEI
jgi:hypothetical protein